MNLEEAPSKTSFIGFKFITIKILLFMIMVEKKIYKYIISPSPLHII